MSTVSKSSQIVSRSQTLKSKASVKTPPTCDCTTAEAVSEPTFKMNEEQLKLIRDSLKTIQQTIQADLAKKAHTQRTKLDTLQSKLNKPDAHGLRGKHTLSASSVLNPRQFQHIACPVAVNLSMSNASYNVFGIPHFIRATDAHIAVAIYSLLTPTTLRLKHIRHEAITFIFLIIQVWALFSTTLKRLPMIFSSIPLSLHDLQA